MNDISPSFADAKNALEKVINKSRVHLYKPIQIAEILYRDRVYGDIDLNDLETYRKSSKTWRDKVCKMLVGRTSTSSAKFQDNLFEDNALPPKFISILGKENRENDGSVEKFIYRKFQEKFENLDAALNYCSVTPYKDFQLHEFFNYFKEKSGLTRSIDKVYEIVVYALFSSLIDAMGMQVDISVKDSSNPIINEFSDFSEKVLGVDSSEIAQNYPAKLFRVGVTNAADRGLDMWGNFGLAIQIKHISLSEKIVESVIDSISADRIVIICKDAEEKIIYSVLSQIGWKGRIQAIVTFNELNLWYNRAMRGTYAEEIGKSIIEEISLQIETEFPSTAKNKMITEFYNSRGYLF